MASSNASSLQLPQNIDKLVFESPFPDEYVCPICMERFREPYMTQCGHRFCKTCITKYLTENVSNCPTCRQNTKKEDLHPDRAGMREMLELRVFCKGEDGVPECQWVGQLQQFSNHRENCLYFGINCNLCGQTMLRKDTADHNANKCPCRKTACEKCKKSIFAVDKKTHLQRECEETVIKCPNCEKVTLKRKYIEDHCRSECSDAMVSCPLSTCDTFCKRKELEKHFSKYSTNHILALAKQVNTLQSQIAESGGNDVRLILARLDRLEQRADEYLKDGPLRSDGSFLWEIKNYRSQLANAVHTGARIFSDPFYTSPYGFKFCMGANLNGVPAAGRQKSTVGTHCAIYFHMMSGEYDNVQEWPFSGVFTVKILDQSNRPNGQPKKHACDVSTVSKKNSYSSFKMMPPNSVRNPSGFGFYEFCELSIINDSNSNYIKDDTLKIFCTIKANNTV